MDYLCSLSLKQRLSKNWYHKTYSDYKYWDSAQRDSNENVCAPKQLDVTTEGNVSLYKKLFEVLLIGKPLPTAMQHTFETAVTARCAKDKMLMLTRQLLSTFADVLSITYSEDIAFAVEKGEVAHVASYVDHWIAPYTGEVMPRTRSCWY